MSQAVGNIPAFNNEINVGTSEYFRENAQSASTLRTYRAAFASFSTWCASRGEAFLPPSERTVGDYLAEKSSTLKFSTLSHQAASIKWYCQQAGFFLNISSPYIKDVLLGIRRTTNRKPFQAAAIMPDDIRTMVRGLPNTLTSIRNKAVLLVGFCGAFRRSEIVGIDFEHLQILDSKMVIFLPQSKGDRKNAGATVSINKGASLEMCPIAAMQVWLNASSTTSGPVFRRIFVGDKIGQNRIDGRTVGVIVQTAASAVGITAPDGEGISAHGLRSGFITAAYKSGASDEQIMAHSRHVFMPSMRDYVRHNCLDQINTSACTGL